MANRNKKTTAIIYIILSFLSFVFLIPLYYVIINSLRPMNTTSVIFPKKIDFSNYYLAVTLIPFFRYLKNSLTLEAISIFITIPVNFLVGYAFARLSVKGKDKLFAITLAQMMIPAFALQVPQYMLFSLFGIRDTYWIWVLTALCGGSYSIFLFRQYFRNIPKELEEAAIIDGCGYFSIIWHIYVPICRAVIAIVFFTMFISTWGDYLTPFMYLSPKKYPLALALFGDTYSMPGHPEIRLDTVTNAAALLLAVPVLVVFLFCQKSLVKGVTAGSVKG